MSFILIMLGYAWLQNIITILIKRDTWGHTFLQALTWGSIQVLTRYSVPAHPYICKADWALALTLSMISCSKPLCHQITWYIGKKKQARYSSGRRHSISTLMLYILAWAYQRPSHCSPIDGYFTFTVK